MILAALCAFLLAPIFGAVMVVSEKTAAWFVRVTDRWIERLPERVN